MTILSDPADRSDALRRLILDAAPVARPEGGLVCVRFGEGLGRDKVSSIGLTLAARKMGFRNIMSARFAASVAVGQLCPVQATVVALCSDDPAATFARLEDDDHVWTAPQTESFGVIAVRVQPLAVRPGSRSRQYLDRDEIDSIAGPGTATGDRYAIGLARALRIIGVVRSIQRDPEYVAHPFIRMHGPAKPLELVDLEPWLIGRHRNAVAIGSLNA